MVALRAKQESFLLVDLLRTLFGCDLWFSGLICCGAGCDGDDSALRFKPPVSSVRRDTVLIGLLAIVPPVAAFAVFGVIETPDSVGYIAYAMQILHGTVPSGSALLHASAEPISLFRAPGYPAVLAALGWTLPGSWRVAAVVVQVLASAMLAAAGYRVALRLGVERRLAIVAALLPAIGFGLVHQISILTDALNAVFIAGAALALVSGPELGLALVAGLLLGAETTFREATPVFALAYLPLAWLLGGRVRMRVARMGLVLLPAVLVAGSLATWNVARIGRLIVTTAPQTIMVYALMPAVRWGVPVFAGADAFDRIARETVGGGDYEAIDPLHQRLFDEAGMTAPDMADAAAAVYFRTWRRFPFAMAWLTLQNFRYEYLALPFEPVDSVGVLMTYAEHRGRPAFVRLNVLWARLLHGDGWAGVWIVLDVVTRAVGTAICVAGIVLPWLPGRSWRLRGLWLVCAGLVVIYLPLHLEPRYVLGVVPLVCLMAAAGVRPGGA